MKSRNLKTTDRSIKDQFLHFKVEKAISEYVWNGFDANATQIRLSTVENGINGIDLIQISDNGDGIDINALEQTFDIFLDSQKKSEFTPITRGKKGRGRFTFCKFAKNAHWHTWSSGTGFDISIHSGQLNKYDTSDIYSTKESGSGTEVRFENVEIDLTYFNEVIVPYLNNEFTWILLSNPQLKIFINGSLMKLAGYQIKNHKEKYEENEFTIKSVLWAKKPSTEKSYIYFINSKNKIIHKELSELNHKNFYCSSYVTSEWFDGFEPEPDILKNSEGKESDVFQHIFALAKDKLRQEYILFRASAADRLINTYLKEGVFPEFESDNMVLNDFHRTQLIHTVKTIYEAEPAIFSKNLNITQKKILIKLLDRIVNTNKVAELFNVLEGVVSLSEESISKISGILQRTTLENIVKTIEHINDRLDIIDYFKKLIYDFTKFAYEVPHIQKCIESNLWILGEQYHLLTSEEDKFDKALREFLKFRGENHYDKYSVDHPAKNREMDIFAAQRGFRISDDGQKYFHHIVVELKRPSIKLSDTELNQIKEYKNVIASNSQFVDQDSRWDFILIGNEISDSDITAANLKAEIETNRIHCEPGLVQKTGNIKIFVKTWKQVLNEFELRYNELSDRLKLEELEIVKATPDSLADSINLVSKRAS